MRDRLSIYKIWAPDDAEWTGWAKPALFAKLQFTLNHNIPEKPSADYVSGASKNTLIILDLPGRNGVDEALMLAEKGWRPVPLYNGVWGPAMIVDISGIEAALYAGAEKLEKIQISPDAPPAFMLDSSRMEAGGRLPGTYDNRWCVFPQDMPSAEYLKKKGIDRVIVRSKEIQEDLSHVLCRYQEQGIKIYLCDISNYLQLLTVKKPSGFKRAVYRFQVISRLKRNAAGGFGGRIPDPMQSSGGRYYGVG